MTIITPSLSGRGDPAEGVPEKLGRPGRIVPNAGPGKLDR